MLRIDKVSWQRIFGYPPAFFLERRFGFKLGAFTFYYWRTLSRWGSGKDALKAAATIQQHTDEDIILWF